MPNINTPITDLKRLKYLAPFKPIDILSITGKGNPCFCDGLPINDINKQINIEAANEEVKTSAVLRLYIKYKEAINAKPAMVWMLLAQKQNKSIDVHVLLLGLTVANSKFFNSIF